MRGQAAASAAGASSNPRGAPSSPTARAHPRRPTSRRPWPRPLWRRRGRQAAPVATGAGGETPLAPRVSGGDGDAAGQMWPPRSERGASGPTAVAVGRSRVGGGGGTLPRGGAQWSWRDTDGCANRRRRVRAPSPAASNVVGVAVTGAMQHVVPRCVDGDDAARGDGGGCDSREPLLLGHARERPSRAPHRRHGRAADAAATAFVLRYHAVPGAALRSASMTSAGANLAHVRSVLRLPGGGGAAPPTFGDSRRRRRAPPAAPAGWPTSLTSPASGVRLCRPPRRARGWGSPPPRGRPSWPAPRWGASR